MDAPEKLKAYQRKYLINKTLQLTIILYSVTLAACVSFANFLIDCAISGRFGAFARVSVLVAAPVGLFLVFGTAIIFGLVLTNRMAGPIFRLRVHMEEAAEGKSLKPMEFRKADYFSDLVEPYNKIITKLSKK